MILLITKEIFQYFNVSRFNLFILYRKEWKIRRRMKTLITLLLTLLVSGDLRAESPEDALYKYFELFNIADKEAINKASDSPFVFLIGNSKTVSEYYGDSVDFEGLKTKVGLIQKLMNLKFYILMNCLRW